MVSIHEESIVHDRGFGRCYLIVNFHFILLEMLLIYILWLNLLLFHIELFAVRWNIPILLAAHLLMALDPLMVPLLSLVSSNVAEISGLLQVLLSMKTVPYKFIHWRRTL